MSRILIFLILSIQGAILSSCMSTYDLPTVVAVTYWDLKPLERKWAVKGFRVGMYKPLADLQQPQDWNTGRLELSLWANEPIILSLEEARKLVQELYRDYYALVAPQFKKKGMPDPRMRIEVDLSFVDPFNEPTKGTAISFIKMNGRERTFSGMINGKEILMGMIREDVREELADLVDEHNLNGQ